MFLTALSAASFTIFARSAPDAPAVSRPIFLKSTSSDILIFLECTFNTAILPLRSGNSTGIRLSKRPGRSKAGSSTSGLFVAASTTIPFLESKPSISVSNWFRACSLSSFEEKDPSRDLPMASISSINMMHGAFSCASLNNSLTLLAASPTNISTKDEPDMEMNGTSASPATACARRVLPVPGGPTSKAPLGRLAPILAYLSG